jgi:hypothetical protein
LALNRGRRLSVDGEHGELLANLHEEVKGLRLKNHGLLNDLHTVTLRVALLEQQMTKCVNTDQFTPVSRVVNGLVALVLCAVMTALVSLVVRR